MTNVYFNFVFDDILILLHYFTFELSVIPVIIQKTY